MLAVLSLGARARAATAVDPTRDVRLARRVYLRAEGQPLGRVLQRLSTKGGVTLSVAGAAAEERLVAFVPDASVAEVMDSIAELYRLRWVRWSGERPAYRLIKPPAALREEAELRERCFREALQRIARGLEAEEQAEEPEDGTVPAQTALRKVALKLVKQHWSQLLNEGIAAVPVTTLPRGEQGKIMPVLQRFLIAEHQDDLQTWRARLEEARKSGEDNSPDLQNSEPSPPADARNCTFTLELRVQDGVELFGGLRDGKADHYRTYHLFRGRDEGLHSAGASLYRTKSLRPTPEDAAAGKHLDVHADPPFDRPVDMGSLQPAGRERWVTGLEQLSQASGAALYSDDYPQGAFERNRLTAVLAQGGPVAAAMDRLCGPSRQREPRSFWWQHGNAAFVRSSNWLWAAGTAPPAGFYDSLAAALRGQPGDEHLDASVLPALASLTVRQAQGLFTIPAALDAWRYGAVVASGLGPSARRLVFEERGLSWTDLAPPEQLRLGGISPPPRSGSTPAYWAHISGHVFRSDHDQGPAIHLEIKGTWGTDEVYAGIQIPLPERNRYGLLVLDPERAHPQPVVAPRLVAALYYPWYGLPAISGSYRHLQGVATAERKIASFAHYPAAGPYDSSDEATMRRHLSELKSAGVDVLVCSWWGPGSFEERAIRKLLPLAEAAGLRVCLYAEAFGELRTHPTVEQVASSLGETLDSLGQHPAYLTVQGRSVLFIHEGLTAKLDLQGWADVFASLRKRLGSDVIAVTRGASLTDSLVFAGLQIGGFSMNGDALENPDQIRSRKRLVIGTVLPGLDLRHQTKDPHAMIEPANGEFYKSMWRSALAMRPDWVLIESFNHWEIGTEIEPSTEFGDRYLRQTAAQAAEFKNSPIPGHRLP